MLRLSCIGLGRVGQTIVKLLSHLDTIAVHELVVPDRQHWNRVSSFVGTGKLISNISEMTTADLIMITTPDRVIDQVVGELTINKNISPQSIIFHCSGTLSSEVIRHHEFPHSASIHPLRSFATPESASKDFPGTFCGVEGDSYAIDKLRPLFEQIGARIVPIDSEKKTIYHAASVFASNYLVALHEVATSLFESSGLDRVQSTEVTESLMNSALKNIKTYGVKRAITGPVSRGDDETVAKHEAVLATLDSSYVKLYSQMATAIRTLIIK